MSRDQELCDYLARSGVEWAPLDESSRAEAEGKWREVYGRAFGQLRPGSDRGQRPCSLTSKRTAFASLSFLLRLPSMGSQSMAVLVHWQPTSAAVLWSLWVLSTTPNVSVCPTDLAWTMVHTDEDHGFGGPFFIKEEWLP